MIGSHSSISAGAGGTGVGPPSAPSGGVHHGADEGGGRGIYIISDSTLNSNLNLGSRRTNTTISTASESLEMMTTASSSSYSRGSRPAVPRSYSDVIPEDVRGGQLPGAIPEDLEIGSGPPVVKQELRDETSSDSGSRTSVFSDILPCGLTRFHFSLCFGMVGFVVFWLGLLLRIYLPH